MRADPMFRDVTSDSQLQGPAGVAAASTATAPTRSACRSTTCAPRSTAPSASARSRRSTPPVDSYQVILEVAPTPTARTRARSTTSTCARKNGALVPLSSFATVERTVGPTAINHSGQLQAVTVSFNLAPGARAGRRDRRRSSSIATQLQHAGVDHHQLRRRRGGVPELAGQPGDPDRRGAAGDLRAARRAVRELHPPADDPGRPAVGGGRRAADAARCSAST